MKGNSDNQKWVNMHNPAFIDPTPFFSKSSLDLKKIPIDYESYEESQENIIRLIQRLSYRRSKAKLSERVDLVTKIGRLRAIEKDLQKALEK